MEFVKIIHPPTGNIYEAPESSLGQHYRAGWAPLDETPEPGAQPDPKPVRAKAASKARNDSKEGD